MSHAALTGWLIACGIEFGQLYGLVAALGLEHSSIARTVLGTGFDPWDFAAYTGGAVAILGAEALRRRRDS